MRYWPMIAVLFSLPSMACKWHSPDVVGTYETTDHQGFFESFILDDDGNFRSWLHDRPDVFGEWQLDKNCQITVTSEGLAEPVTLALVSLTDSNAEFVLNNNHQHYHRTELN